MSGLLRVLGDLRFPWTGEGRELLRAVARGSNSTPRGAPEMRRSFRNALRGCGALDTASTASVARWPDGLLRSTGGGKMRCTTAIRSLNATILCLAATATAGTEIDLASSYGDWVAWSAAPNSYTGRTVLVADLNGDRFPDLIFEESAWRDIGGAIGRISVFLGPHSLPAEQDLTLRDPDVYIRVLPTEGSLGGHVLASNDVDGDGIADLFFGLATPAPQSNRGLIAVFRGRTVWPAVLTVGDADWRFLGMEASDMMVQAVAGDLNGDRVMDLALGA